MSKGKYSILLFIPGKCQTCSLSIKYPCVESMTKEKLFSICGVTRVNTDCDTLVEYLGNLSNKIEYDKFLHKTMVVEEINENLQICGYMMSLQSSFDHPHNLYLCPKMHEHTEKRQIAFPSITILIQISTSGNSKLLY